jgi:hypothetical protein
MLIFDLEDGAVASYQLSWTPALILLKRPLDFTQDVTLVDSRQNKNDVQIMLSKADDDSGAYLVLYFTLDGGGRLLKWNVCDPQGNITSVKVCDDTVQLNNDSLVTETSFDDESLVTETVLTEGKK